MPRYTDHESRRREILFETIQLYLDTAQPVSSEALLKGRKVRLSSASIRNVFAELEAAGYLTHPHTSAGRIPTDKGYRFYVNTLMRKKNLNRNDVDFIDKIYELKVNELTDLLSETSRLMADFTHYVSAVYLDEDDEEMVKIQGMRYLLEHPEFSDIRKAHAVLEALENPEDILGLLRRNVVGSVEVYIGHECSSPRMENCAIVISRCESDVCPQGRLALIGPKRMAYEDVIPLMDYLSKVVTQTMERF